MAENSISLNISKELLSEVLNEEVEVIDIKTSIDDYSIPTNEIRYYPVLSTGYKSINTYEFAFKCKDWALSNGYFIYSTHELSFIKSLSLETIKTFANGKDTEIECILKACEWLLEEQKNEMC